MRRSDVAAGERVVRWLGTNARTALVTLLAIAAVLRGLLVARSPTDFGYVWDFYFEGARILARTGRLPAAADCWQCYHPPLFYVLGWPLYSLGSWIASGSADADAQGLRWLALLGTAAAAVTTYYGYRLLRLFGCRGASLVLGFGLLVTFPCLFISSYGAEADIVLTAIMSAFVYYLTRDLARSPSILSALRLGALAGLAAATKYSGLVAIVSGSIAIASLRARGAARRSLLRDVVVMTVVCGLLGGWKYADNYARYGTPLYANGTAMQGFTLAGPSGFHGQYEFTSFRLRDLMRVLGPRAGRGALTDLPVYRSVFTTLHGLAWSDMSFFSEPTRHGDPSHPYPRKHLPFRVARLVLILATVPELLAVLGVAVTIRRPIFRPLAIVSAVAIAAYVWWFLSQDAWGLKTKYLLFLAPVFIVYVVAGLGWLWRRAPSAGAIAGALVAALVLVTHVYLLAFALG